MKKTLVVLLALMMVFAFATTAMAADEQYVPYNDIADQDVDIQTAIERLSILGALKGYDAEGTKYAPAQLITREEFATIGVRIAGLEDQVALYASMASSFKDIEEGRWSEGYVNAANANGIMIGRGNGTFDPKANVTMQEVTTVLLRAVGYDDRLPGAWPSDYNTKAVNVGLTEYVDYVGPKAATRAEVASLANQALDLWTVQYVDDSTGLGQIIGGIINAAGIMIPAVDKDGYMYVTDATNEEGNYGITLLNQNFDAYTVDVTFWDDEDEFSEAAGWDFADFADWELEAYFANNVIVDGIEYGSFEFASVYGISKGQDVTDLGWQDATLTMSMADDEIIYVDLTSDIVRTADATADQEDDSNNVIAEGDYGEIWYDADGDAYAAKDFAAFANEAYGIVDSMDADGIYFNDSADLPAMADIDLDDNIAFYLLGEGFIDAADVEVGDVIYFSDYISLGGADGLALVIRPVDATLDDLADDYIEIDDINYNAINNYSFFSYDMGNAYFDYDYDRILGLELDFTGDVVFAPAYAFANFAYFADNLQHAGSGVIDNYAITGGGHRLDNAGNDRNVTGMNVLSAGADEAALINFDSTLKAAAIDDKYPVEGSYVEYIMNADGEMIVTGEAIDFSNTVIFGQEAYQDDVTGEWTASNRLALNDATDADLDDVYRLASDAVIYMVESNADGVYDLGSAQALTAAEFEALGDFAADGLEIIDANGTTINALYVRDADFIGDIEYGIGIYEGEGVIQSRSDRFYINVDGERVFIDDFAAKIIRDNVLDGVNAAIVAYKTEGGKIVDVADIVAVDTAADVDNFKAWTADTGYEMLAGSVNMIDGYTNAYGQIDVNAITNCTVPALHIGEFTFICDADSYINGYDVNDGFGLLEMSDFKTRVTNGANIIGVYVPGTNDLVYLMIL